MKKAIWLFLFPLSLFAQQASRKAIGVNYLGGNLFFHTAKIKIPKPAYNQGIEISYSTLLGGKKEWHQRFGFPETGIHLCVADNGNRLLGYSIGLYPSIQFRWWQQGKWQAFFKIGGGIGIVTKHWQRVPISDTINNIIGGLVNNFTQMQVGGRYYVSQNLGIQGGLFFHHASNAAARQPNLGLNTYGLYVGAIYLPKGYISSYTRQQLSDGKQPIRIGAKLGFGMAEDKIPNGPMYRMYNITVFAAKGYLHKNSVWLGSDMTYNSSLYAKYQHNGNYIGVKWKYAWRYSVFAAHEFVFGKTGLYGQLGYYLNRPIGGPKLYQRLGILYHPYRHKQKDLFFSLQLKTHLAQAEHAEIGMGFMF